ncbi:MAG: superoxide dismutase family protein [Acidimicrobiales bacterium]
MARTTKLAAALGAAVALSAVVTGIGMTVAAARGGDEVLVVLRDATGAPRGTVQFRNTGEHTEVKARINEGIDGVAVDAFHGFHIHANDDPANGEGCVADPAAEPKTWFVSADGHWKEAGQTHAGHHGDLPSLLITSAGVAESRFVTDRIDLDQLPGKAVIMHAGPDNFGNVPVGTGDNQYSPNSPEAVTATANTGNACDRLLCGVVG